MKTFSVVTHTDLFYISASDAEAAAKACLCAFKYGELEKWRSTIGDEDVVSEDWLKSITYMPDNVNLVFKYADAWKYYQPFTCYQWHNLGIAYTLPIKIYRNPKKCLVGDFHFHIRETPGNAKLTYYVPLLPDVLSTTKGLADTQKIETVKWEFERVMDLPVWKRVK